MGGNTDADDFVGGGFEWSKTKQALNVLNHGIDFADAVMVFADEHAITYRTYPGSDNERWVTVGKMFGRIIAVIHTPRGEQTRVISARMARDRERDAYDKR